ncbi:MAG: UbiD family decarboxylase domain-containing protein, partial [Nitrososphaerales archaeon]
MPFPSLRTFLKRVEEHGFLQHVNTIVTNKWLTTAISADLFEKGGSGYGANPKAVMFDYLEAHQNMRTVSNLFGHVDLISLMMSSKRATIFDDYLEKVARPLPPQFFKDAPFLQNSYSGKQVDIGKIVPVETSAEKQTTPFLTLWSVIFEDPEDHTYSLVIYRLQVKSKNHTGLLTIKGQRTFKVIEKYAKMKKPMPIALVNGPPPTVTLASAMKAPSDVWKMDYAGALNGEGIDCI